MSKGNKSQTEERNSHKCFVILHCSNWMWFHFLMKFWNETAAGNPVSVSVKIITFLLFVQDWESFGWSNRCRASKSITSDIFLVGSERSRAKVGAVTSRAKDSGHYTFSRCRLPLSGVPLWRSHPVVHGRHCRSRRRDRGMSSIHAWPIWNCDSFGVIRLYFVSVFSAVLTSPSWSKCQNLPSSLSFSFFK